MKRRKLKIQSSGQEGRQDADFVAQEESLGHFLISAVSTNEIFYLGVGTLIVSF